MGPKLPICHISHCSTRLRAARLLGQETAGLARQVEQDRAGLEDRDRLAAGAVGVDDRRDHAARADRHELGGELLVLADIHGMDVVGQLELLERDGDLAPVGRAPGIKLDGHVGSPRQFFVGAEARRLTIDFGTCQGLLQVGDQISGILDADRQAQQVRGHRAGRPLDRGAVLDQALDPAERGGAHEQAHRLGDGERGLGAAAYPQGQHAAEAARHLALGDPVARMALQTRIEHGGDLGVALEVARDGERVAAGAPDPEVERAQAALQEPGFEGAEHAAGAVALVAQRSQKSSRRAVTSAPARTSPWPLRYLVPEWNTRSAPSAIGRVSTGVATVESTANSAPAPWATSAAAAMSITSQVGLQGVSIHTSLVVPGRTARASAAGSS